MIRQKKGREGKKEKKKKEKKRKYGFDENRLITI